MSARVRDVFVYDLGPAIAAMPVSVDQPVECEIQLCRTGAFYRSDQGHFKVTPRTLEKMLANAIERGVDIPVNYFHKGNDPTASKDDREAAGWVSPKSLTIRGYKGGYALFGKAVWTAEAVQKLKDKKLRYISPEIDWVATRLAASELGPAGQPIGPMLTGAALVNDPFFTMNPVTLSRRAPQRGQRAGAPKRYSMFDKKTTDAMSAVLKDNGMPEANIPAALLALIQLDEAADMAQEAPTPDATVIAEATPPDPATQGAAQASLAAARESNKALAARVAQLEARDAVRETEQSQALFGRYMSEGRFRVYAVAGSDPTGEKKAKEHLAKGLNFFREVFDAVPPLVGTRAPVVIGKLPTATVAAAGMAGEDKGAALHTRVMGELKTKNLTLTTSVGKAEYNRLADQFSREA